MLDSLSVVPAPAQVEAIRPKVLTVRILAIVGFPSPDRVWDRRRTLAASAVVDG